MKKILVFLILSIITVTSCINVFAANYSRIVDEADLLSYDQEQELEAYIDEVSEKHKFDLVIVTVNSLNGKTSSEFADDFYDYNDYGFGEDKDGALLLISMEDGDWAISTCGEGIYTYDDSLLDELEDNCISKLSDNDYFGACKSFISISEDAFTFPLLSRIIISLIVGFFIAFCAVNMMKRKLITVQKQIGAKVYTKPDSMQVTSSRDVFLYSHVTKRARPKNNSRSHTSSSGRSHGGRSGKF